MNDIQSDTYFLKDSDSMIVIFKDSDTDIQRFLVVWI